MDYIIKNGGKIIVWLLSVVVFSTLWYAQVNDTTRRVDKLEPRVSTAEQQLSGINAQLSQMNGKLDLLLNRAVNK